MNGKILLALQYWDGDKRQAMKLARLIADLEPQHSSRADFLFVSRFDSEHDVPTIQHVSKKFNTFHYVNRQRGTEWPHGCNALWFGTMEYIFAHRNADMMPEYKAVLTFEADSCPLAPNWISDLHSEWDRAKRQVVGALLKAPGEHINGNALFSADLPFLKWVAREVGGCSPHAGWDYVLAQQFKKRGWADSPKFRSWWKTPTCAPETFHQLLGQGVSFLHGVKDDSLLDLVRARFVR